jgi:hypothetical protein
MTKPDPTLALIATQFARHDVEKSGAAYTIIDRRTSTPVARLCPIKGTDRFELFYWSNVNRRWKNFGTHETHARQRSRNRRERSDVPRSTSPVNPLQNWPKSS